MRPIFLVALIVPAALAAQEGIPFSQHGAVLQVVGYDTISIRYNRPVARGRRLFGHLVPWDQVWHPGADSASTITFGRDILVEGKPLTAGSYTLWTVPDSLHWTVIFSKAVNVFHTPYPGAQFDVLRVSVTPQTGDYLEVLTYYFPVVGPDSATLRLHWGNTIVPIRFHTR